MGGSDAALLVVASWILGLFVSFPTFVMSAAMVQGTVQELTGGTVTPRTAYLAVLPKIPTLSLAALMSGAAVLLMGVTIIGIPFAIYFGLRWSFVSQAVIIDGTGARAALSRSSDLVRGHWWDVSWTLAGLGLVFGLLSLVLALPVTLPELFDSVSALISGDIPKPEFSPFAFLWSSGSGAMIAPLFPIAQTLLYYRLRAGKEGSRFGEEPGSAP